MQYTPVQTAMSATHSLKRGGSTGGSGGVGIAASGSVSGVSSKASSAGTELEFSAESTAHFDAQMGGICMNVPNSHSPAVRPSTTMGGSSSRGIGFDDCTSQQQQQQAHLPHLASSASTAQHHSLNECGTPPRLQSQQQAQMQTPPSKFKQQHQHQQSGFLPPASGANGGSNANSPTKHDKVFNCNQKNPIATNGTEDNCSNKLNNASTGTGTTSTTSNKCSKEKGTGFQRAPPGDHWAVDDDIVLPSDLRVHIPQSNIWLGKISHECIGFLRGMFDIRPSHRLSSRDIEALRLHPWMQVNGVHDWEEMYNHNFTPNFKPGKRFIKETLGDISNTMLMGVGNHLHDPDGDSAADNYAAPTAKQQQQQDYGDMPMPQDDSAEGTGGVLTAEQRASFRGFRYTAAPLQALFTNREPGDSAPHVSTASTSTKSTNSSCASTTSLH